MNLSKQVEITVGLFMLAGVAALVYLALQVSNLGSGYRGASFDVAAYFDNIGGLKTKAPVTIAGVEVGRVKSIVYDPQRFRAKVTLGIRQSMAGQIPDDTFAKILTAGLLGEQYIGLEPGGSDQALQQGSEILITQSALVLEDVVGQFLFSKAQEGAQ